MRRSTLPAHRVYTCRNCGDTWLEENEKVVYENRRCLSCRSNNISRSSSLPLPLAHELLRKGVIYSVKNVARLVENSSADKLKKYSDETQRVFNEQVELLTNIYDVIIMNAKDV